MLKKIYQNKYLLPSLFFLLCLLAILSVTNTFYGNAVSASPAKQTANKNDNTADIKNLNKECVPNKFPN